MVKGQITLAEDCEGISGAEILDVLHVAMENKLNPENELVTIIPIDFKNPITAKFNTINMITASKVRI